MKKQNEGALYVSTALAVPAIQAASSSGWLAVLGLGLLCSAMLLGSEILAGAWETPRWVRILQGLWLIPVIAELLNWTALPWQGRLPQLGIPLILLAAALYTAGDESRCKRAVCVLRYALIILLGAVILAGLRETELPQQRWRLNNPAWITVLLLPSMTKKEEKGRKLLLPILGTLTAFVVGGVLQQEAVKTGVPIYEMSRSLSLFSSVGRYEGLVAAGMAIGYFCAFCYCLGAIGQSIGKRWPYAIAAAATFLLGIVPDGRLLALGSILVFVLLPCGAAFLPHRQKKGK